MNTLSVTVRYRPIRLGWCMRSGDFEALRKALRLSFTMWGGCFNPIIPIDNFEFASSLIRLFRVDVLWPASQGPDVQAFIEKFKHLPNPFFHNELFTPNMGGRKNALLADIYHPIRSFYEKHFKNNPSPAYKVKIHEWQPDDPLADLMIATLGALPSAEITGIDYLTLLKQNLKAEPILVTPKEPFPVGAENELLISALCRIDLSQHYSVQNKWGAPGFYIGRANDFEDLITYWNLRATDASLMFYDPNHAARLDDRRIKWLDILRSRPRGRFEVDNRIPIWFKEESPEPDLGIFGDGLTINKGGHDIWNGFNIKAPYMYLSESEVLATVGDSAGGLQEISFQLPQKPFSEGMRFSNEHIVVAVAPGIGLYGNERTTLQTPYLPELNEYYGRECFFKWDETRVEPNGLGIISRASSSTMSLRSLDVTELISQIFGVIGIIAEPSIPGLVATRLIQQMGGRLQSCRPFKIPGVRHLIENYGPEKTFTRSNANQMIRDEDTATGNYSFSLHEKLHIEPRKGGIKLTPDAVLAYLLKKDIFRAGLRFDCPNCKLQFWTSLDDVHTEATCIYCGYRFNITPFLKDRDWAFRRSGLFGRADNQEGAIPVVLTLMQLNTMLLGSEMLYSTAMTLKPSSANIHECETDFVVIVQHINDQMIDIAIGECKARKAITNDDVKNLLAVADVFPGDRFRVYIIFSKLVTFTAEEIANIRQVNDKYGHRAILFTPRELEPYYVYERTAKEFEIDQYASSFEQMANVTEKVFFRSGADNGT